MDNKHNASIMRCNRYDPDIIAGIVKEGMTELQAVPSGRVLPKPKMVAAHPDLYPCAFTRREFLSGVIGAAKQMAREASEIAVGERSGIALPTRRALKKAGYPRVVGRVEGPSISEKKSKSSLSVTAQVGEGRSIQ